jgi:4-aminobutyrate aminotransferase
MILNLNIFFSFRILFNYNHIMSDVSNLVQFGKAHIAKGIGRSTELVIEKAKGTFVYTIDGKKYLDLSTGIGVTNTG